MYVNGPYVEKTINIDGVDKIHFSSVGNAISSRSSGDHIFIFLEATDNRTIITTSLPKTDDYDKLIVINVARFAPNFSSYLPNTQMKNVMTRLEMNSFHYLYDHPDGGLCIMNKTFDDADPEVLYKLADGETAVLRERTYIISSQPMSVGILDVDGIVYSVMNTDEKTFANLYVNMESEEKELYEPKRKTSEGDDDNDSDDDSDDGSDSDVDDYNTVTVSVEDDYYFVIEMLGRILRPPQSIGKISSDVEIYDGNNDVSIGSGVTSQYLINGYEEYRQRHFVGERFVHFNSSIKEMKKNQLYLLGRMLRVCGEVQRLGNLPILLVHAMYDKSIRVLNLLNDQSDLPVLTDEQLEMFVEECDPVTYESLITHKENITELDYESYREALEHVSGVSVDKEMIDQITMIAEGYVGYDSRISKKGSPIKLWKYHAKPKILPRSSMKLQLNSAVDDDDDDEKDSDEEKKKPELDLVLIQEQLDTVKERIMQLNDEDFSNLLFNWSSDRTIGRGKYEINFGDHVDGIAFHTCSSEISANISYLSNIDDFIEQITTPINNFNTM
jgi:hypothetical protein